MCACSRRHSQPHTVPCFTQWRSRLTEYLSCRRSCTCASMRYCPSMSVTMAVCLRSGAPHAGMTVPAHAPKKKRQLSCYVQHDSRLAHYIVHTSTHMHVGRVCRALVAEAFPALVPPALSKLLPFPHKPFVTLCYINTTLSSSQHDHTCLQALDPVCVCKTEQQRRLLHTPHQHGSSPEAYVSAFTNSS